MFERIENATLLDRSAVRLDGDRHYVLTRQPGSSEISEIEIQPIGVNATHYVLSEGELPERLVQLANGASS